MGGEDTPAVGFAMGMERLISLLPAKDAQKLDAYVVSTNQEEAIKLVGDMRKSGLSVDFDMTNKKFTKQLEKASKVAKFALILGEDEIKSEKVAIKNLATSKQITVDRQDVLTTIRSQE